MTDDREEQEQDTPGATSPPDGQTHEATTPPGQGDRDDDATTEAEDKLDQAGGGH
jgi:hypothetical protein